MNFKLVSVAAALAMSAAVAQDFDDDEEETDTAAETTAEAPAAPAVDDSWTSSKTEAAPATAQAPAQAGLFDVLHGNAYNLGGNEAGAATIGGDFAMPHKMAGRKLIYVEPSAERANLSFANGGMTYLLAFDNSLDLGMVTAGFATGNLGVTVDLALDKTWESTEVSTEAATTEADVSTTRAGDLIRLNFSMGLGAMDFKADLFWLTFKDETDSEDDNVEVDNDYWDWGFDVTLSNAPSAKGLFWSAGLNFFRQASETETTPGSEVTYDDAYLMLQPFFNVAIPLMSVENAQLFIGTNSRIPLTFYDEIKNGDSENNRFSFALYTAPNILAEVSLTENWMVFGGASYEWKLFGYHSDETKVTGSTTDKSTITMKTYSTSANAGARFSYKNFVLEASVAEALGSDTWSGLIANLGAFIHF